MKKEFKKNNTGRKGKRKNEGIERRGKGGEEKGYEENKERVEGWNVLF